jgi:Uncharacterised protein family (UPF0158)
VEVDVSHDRWRDQLHDAGADAARLVALLEQGIPADGLQVAGSAILATTPSSELAAVVGHLVAGLGERGWIGDAELAGALIDHAQQREEELVRIAVDLDDLADVIDQPSSSESYIDLACGVVWPGELLDFDQGPDDFDPDDAGRWLLVCGEGSTAAYRGMERFIETVEPDALSNRLRQAISGKAPFKTFLATLQRHEAQFTSWHRHRDDARMGRARHWLAEHGYTSTRI